MSSQSTIGVIKEIYEGEIFAIDPDGNIRQLHIGSKVASNERINASKDSAFQIELNNGKIISIPNDLYKHFLNEAIQDELEDAYEIDGLKVVLNNEHPHTDKNPNSDNHPHDSKGDEHTHTHTHPHKHLPEKEPEHKTIEPPHKAEIPHQNEGHPAFFEEFSLPTAPIRPAFPTEFHRVREAFRIDEPFFAKPKDSINVSLNSLCETITEGELGQFILTLDRASDVDIKVTLMFGDVGDTATPGDDYNDVNFVDSMGMPFGDGNMIIIPAGELSVEFFVETFDDDITEFLEKFTIKILSVENVQSSDNFAEPEIDSTSNMGMCFIQDNDCSTVSLRGGDTVTEGELVPYQLCVDKLSDAPIKVTLMFGDEGDTATPGDDYDNTTFYDELGQVIGDGNMITIPAGTQCVDIFVKTLDDMVTEFKEKFTIKILSVENVTDDTTIMDPKIDPENNSVMSFIIDNDCSTVSILGGETVTEGELIPFQLCVDKLSDAPIKVTLMFGNEGDTATPGDDYDNMTFYDDQGQVIGDGNMITIPAGTECVDIYVQTHDDMITEFKEKFTIKILSVENMTDNPMIMDPKIDPEHSSAMGFINDDDCSTVSLTGGDTVTEGELVPFQLCVDKLSDADIKVTLMFGDEGDTATPGDDYDNTTFYDDQGQVIGNGNMITIPAGTECVDIYVQTHDDMITEFKEKFTIKILSVENMTDNPMIMDPKIDPENNSVMSFIVDNDCSTVSLTGGDTVTEGELIPFQLCVDKLSDADIKVTLMFGDEGDTATPGDDYDNMTFYDDQGQVIGDGNMITIPAGTECVDIYVKTNDDMITEFKEKLTIKILSVENMTDNPMIMDPKIDPENNSAMGFIIDNDCSTVSILGGETVTEGELIPFQLCVDKLSDADIKVTLMFGDEGDTATPGDDYDNMTFYDDQGQVIGDGNMITIPAGTECVDIYVKTLDDMITEFKEKVTIKILSVENITENPMIMDPKIDPEHSSAMGFINDDDCSTVSLTGGDTVTEGELVPFQLCVDKLSDADIKVTLMFGDEGDTATPGDDYDNTTFYDDQGQVIGNGNMITIPAGTDCVDIYVKTNDDMITEFKEKFTIKILSVENMTDNPMIMDPKIDPENNSVMSFIVDNDCSTVSLTGGDTVTEGELIPFQLCVDKLSDAPIKVTLMFGDEGDTATPGDDYDNTTFYDDQGQVIGNGNMVTIPAGTECLDIYVKTNDDMITEFKEKLTIKILSVENMTENPMIMDPKIDPENNSAMGFITDNDCSTVSISGGDTVDEGELVPFQLCVDKLSDADIKVTLMFGMEGDTATPGDDYDNMTFYDDQGQVIGDGNMITIPAGTECVDIYVKTFEDEFVEFKETFSIKITAVENVTENPMILDPKFDDTPAMGMIINTTEPTIDVRLGNEVGEDQICVKEDSEFTDPVNEIEVEVSANIPLTELTISGLDSSWMYDLTNLEGAGITVTNNINMNGTILIEFDQPGPYTYSASFDVKPPADSDVDMGVITLDANAAGFGEMIMGSDTAQIVVDAVVDEPMNLVIGPAPGEEFDQIAYAIEQNTINFEQGSGAVLYEINLNTGDATPLGFVFAPGAGGSSGENLDAEAIVLDPKTGCFYTLAKSTGAQDGLFKIDPSIIDMDFKLMVSFITNGGGILETNNLDPAGMAFDSDGTLFAVINDGGDSLIYTIDHTTLNSIPTFIGDTGLSDLAALAILPTGEMYSVLKTGNTNFLYQIDKTDGSVIGMPLAISGPDVGSSVVLESLSVNFDGNLISVGQSSGKVFEIDPDTGSAVLLSTTIGNSDVTGDGIENIVFDTRLHVCDEFDIKVSALFKDLDGSQDHYFLINLPEGWDTDGTKVVNPDGVPAGTYLLIDVDDMTAMAMDTATLIPPNDLETDTGYWIQAYAVAQETSTGDVECDESDNFAVTEAQMLEVIVCANEEEVAFNIMESFNDEKNHGAHHVEKIYFENNDENNASIQSDEEGVIKYRDIFSDSEDNIFGFENNAMDEISQHEECMELSNNTISNDGETDVVIKGLDHGATSYDHYSATFVNHADSFGIHSSSSNLDDVATS